MGASDGDRLTSLVREFHSNVLPQKRPCPIFLLTNPLLVVGYTAVSWIIILSDRQVHMEEGSVSNILALFRVSVVNTSTLNWAVKNGAYLHIQISLVWSTNTVL